MFVSLAKSLNPNIKANEIKKGMKLYDWEHAMFFSLNVVECMKLVNWWESGQHDTNFHLIHNGQDGNTFCDVHKYQEKYYVTISKGKENRIQMPMPMEELKVFLRTVSWMTNNIVGMSDMLTEMGKIQAGKSSFNPGNDKNGKKYENQNGGTRDYNQNQRGEDGQYEQPPQGNYAPPPAPPSVPQGNYAPPPAPPSGSHNTQQSAPPAPPRPESFSI